MARRVITWLAVLVTVVTVWVSIFRMPWILDPETARSFLAEPEPPWQGVLQLWHIHDWPVAASSRNSCLQTAITRLEKAYPGVFVEITDYTPDTFMAALAAGRQPDILCFPGGVEIPLADKMQTLELPETLSIPFAKAASVLEENLWALPWMGTGSLLLLNPALAEEAGWEPEAVQAELAGEAFAETMMQLTHQRGKKNPTTIYGLGGGSGSLLPFAGGSGSLLPGSVDGETLGYRQAWDRFFAQETVILAGTLWDCAAMQRKEEAGRGFRWEVLDMPEELPAHFMVQWVGAMESGDEGKDQLARELVYALFGDAVQKKIASDTGCLPGVEIGEGIVLSAMQQRLYDRLQHGAVRMLRPGCALDIEEILPAATGDAGAALRLGQVFVDWTGDESTPTTP